MSGIECDVEEIEKFEHENGSKFDYIKLSFVNLHGVLISLTMTRESVMKHLGEAHSTFSGYFTWNVEGNSTFVKELIDNCCGNCHIIPIRNTLHLLPWNCKFEKKPRIVGEIFCEGKWLPGFKDGNFIQACTRNLLRRVLENLKTMGYRVKSAYELEVIFLDATSLKPVLNKQRPRFDAKFENMFYEIIETCRVAGVEVAGFHLEDARSQFEFNLDPLEGVKAADAMMLLKQTIKEVAWSRGHVATFMSSPTPECSGNSLHLNLSLWKTLENGKEVNAFFDANDANKMSAVCKHFLAGLLEHTKALRAIFSPTVNCYRRLQARLIPFKIDWNVEDRLVAYRVRNSETSCFIENRIPMASCNVYLTLAASLIAGMDGLKKTTPLCEPARDIRDKVLDEQWRKKCVEREKDKCSPLSLEEALNELENNEVLRDGLGEELVRWFVEIKRESEVKAINSVKEEDKWELERELYLQYF